MHGVFRNGSCDPPCTVVFSPPELVQHRVVAWQGLKADVVQTTSKARVQYDYRSCCHLLIVSEGVERSDGEISVDGLPGSKFSQLRRRLTFIPAGHRVRGWKRPNARGSAVFFHIDPRGPLVDPELRFADADFKPRLFFFDHDLWTTAVKLKAQVENGGAGGARYVEALVIALAHELVRANEPRPASSSVRGALAAWQEKRVADHIEAHVADQIPLATLAGLVQLSPYHFSRAFKRSFGMPPHRYHISRRVEQAKDMLSGRELSVTEIAFRVGFSEASSLTDAFRKFIGCTPIDYRQRFTESGGYTK